jgi:hypothetical protein
VPELDVGDYGIGYDAMAGSMSPLSQQELQAAGSAITAESGQAAFINDGMATSFPARGQGVPMALATAPELGKS